MFYNLYTSLNTHNLKNAEVGSFPGLANYKLSTLCDYLKIPAEGFHRAEADALYCGRLFIHILKKTSFSCSDVKELVRLSGRNPLKFPYSHMEGQLAFFD